MSKHIIRLCREVTDSALELPCDTLPEGIADILSSLLKFQSILNRPPKGTPTPSKTDESKLEEIPQLVQGNIGGRPNPKDVLSPADDPTIPQNPSLPYSDEFDRGSADVPVPLKRTKVKNKSKTQDENGSDEKHLTDTVNRPEDIQNLPTTKEELHCPENRHGAIQTPPVLPEPPVERSKVVELLHSMRQFLKTEKMRMPAMYCCWCDYSCNSHFEWMEHTMDKNHPGSQLCCPKCGLIIFGDEEEKFRIMQLSEHRETDDLYS